jgi:two-component system, OmpR family, phosphate regulon sensor histidine kinase PhoR
MKLNRKIGIILLLVVFLPALFFSVYEIGSLNQNEKIIEKIYNDQLDVILSSVNQYSEDIASGWVVNMNNIYGYPQQDLNSSLKQFLRVNNSIKGVFYSTDTSYSKLEMVFQEGFFTRRRVIENILHDNSKTVNRLYYYLKNNYRKVEVFSSPKTPNLSYFIFLADNYHGHKMLSGMIVDARGFVNQVLAPKIQAIAQESFIISVRDETRKQTVYMSEPVEVRQMTQVKPLWLLPEFKLGIIYKGKTIDQLVRDRTYLNFALILLLDLLFFAGTWFVFRSIKTEIQLSQMRADFISNVSHEIRTPLALISVYVETILLGRLKPDKLHEYHQVIYQETSRLTGIVNKILNFSRIEEKKHQYNFTPVNINGLVESVIQRFDYHLKNKGFIVDVNLLPKLPEVSGDREALLEVLVNLVDNAFKYSKEEKYLSIETDSDKNNIYLIVTDRGIGIPETDQKYVFDKFFRVSAGEVQKERGSGLGLAIVKHIIESHGGEIFLTSALDKGSSFKIILPIINDKVIKKTKYK